MWCYRRLLQTTWKDKRTNTWILERIGTDLHLRSGIMKRKYGYFGHQKRRRDWKANTSRCCRRKAWERSSINIVDRWHEKNCQEMVCMVHHALQRIKMVGVLFWITTAALRTPSDRLKLLELTWYEHEHLVFNSFKI